MGQPKNKRLFQGKVECTPKSGLFLLLIVIAICCNTGEKGQAGKTEPECYLFVQGRDSIRLSVQENNGMVIGSLQFLFYEKDKSRGTVEGEMKGDTLFAIYTFNSEGMLSYREVVFLKKESSFLLGSGEIMNTGNRDVFRNREEIEFSDRVVLKHVACE